MKRVAVLDLGTNTFHLLIADIGKDNPPVFIHTETIAVKLGEGGINQGFINQDAFERGLEAIRSFKASIDLYQAEKIKSAATSAVRSAANGQEFIDQIKLDTGIELNIIDGDQEAGLIYQGVRAAIPFDQNSLIIDIGGGSVEFIICDASQLLWKKSYPIGAARLMEKFHNSDPISSAEIFELTKFIDETLKDLKIQLDIYKPQMMIGSAGAFETFALLQDHEFIADFGNPQFDIDLEKLMNITDDLIKSTHLQRAAMPQIIPVRVDMIVVASILTRHIIKISGIKSLKLSAYSLKEGILFEAAAL